MRRRPRFTAAHAGLTEIRFQKQTVRMTTIAPGVKRASSSTCGATRFQEWRQQSPGDDVTD